jgi:hypothetical protein
VSIWELPKALRSGSKDVASQKVRVNHAGLQLTVRYAIHCSLSDHHAVAIDDISLINRNYSLENSNRAIGIMLSR